MSTRRASLVGDELIADQGAERKRRQAAQLEEARKKKKRGGSGHGDVTKAKQGTQGSEKPAEERRIAREKLQKFDKENLQYPGEQAERRTVIRWFFRAMGEPDSTAWMGQRGAAVEICNRMGIDNSCADNIRKVLQDVVDGVDVREPPSRDRAIKLSDGDCAVVRDCLKSGFGLSQATTQVTARRLKKLEKEVKDGLIPEGCEAGLGEDAMAERLEEMASVSKEWVRVISQRMDGDVHRRQTKKSGTTDTSVAWAVASLAQAEQQLCQLKAGAGDSTSIRRCKNEGWTPFTLQQVFFWDERHRKVCLGCLSSYEWRFPVDPNDPECYLPLSEGGVMPKEMPRTSAKYLSEARKSFGVMMKALEGGGFEGHRAKPFDYTSRKMLSLKEYRKRIVAEVQRVANLKGGIWKSAPKKNDRVKTPWIGGHRLGRVKELRGGRYEALYPGPVRAGEAGTEEEFLKPRPEWEWQIRKVIAHGNSPGISVCDMMDHIIAEGNRLFRDTPYKDSWIIGHDALSVWWEKESLAYLHAQGFGPGRYLCAQGKTNADNRYYKGSLVGNRPELMPLDSNLNADHEYGLMWNVAVTSDLHKDDPKKFKMGTPSEVSDAMDRTWDIFPTQDRIVQDILRFRDALEAIIKHKGAVVPEMNNRKGRRALKAMPIHPDCEDAMAEREIKWERLEAAAAATATESE